MAPMPVFPEPPCISLTSCLSIEGLEMLQDVEEVSSNSLGHMTASGRGEGLNFIKIA